MPHPTPDPDTAQTLTLAAELIEEGGLARHRRSGPGAALSIEGALQAAHRLRHGEAPRNPWSGHRADPGWLPAVAVLRPRTGNLTLEQFSDQATEAEAVALLRTGARS